MQRARRDTWFANHRKPEITAPATRNVVCESPETGGPGARDLIQGQATSGARERFRSLAPELDVRAGAGRHAAPDQLDAPDEPDVARKVDGAAARSVGEGVPEPG